MRNISLFQKAPIQSPILETNGSSGPESTGTELVPDSPPMVPTTVSTPGETRWRSVTLSESGLVPTVNTDPAAQSLVRIREEATPAEFSHLYAALERQTVGLAVIGVTSAIPGEGKTTVALHMSLAAARSSYRRVCLVDLSLGQDELCRRVGAAPAPGGVIGFLESDLPLTVLQWPGQEQMSLFAAGKAPDNAARTARSPRIADLIAALRDDYDLIIVDLPAVSSDNAVPLTRHLDGSVVVTRAGVTPRGLTNQAIETLGRENLIGIVLNRIVPRRKRQWFKGQG